jgi:hypothetical protein
MDGRSDDWWSSGGYPPQWIEIDLQQPRTIAKLQLVAAAQPGGTIFLVLGRGPRTNGAYQLLHQFVGPTDTKQELAFAPRRPWRGIRYLRVTVPSVQAPVGWISWHELHAYPPAPRRR